LADRHKQEQERLDHKGDYRTALVCYVIAETHRNPKARRQPFKISDFMPGSKTVIERQTPEQMLTMVKVLNAAFGGKGGELH
jgi:hypothetical protein